MNKSEDIKDLATALSKAQAEMKKAKLSGYNSFHKSHYSTIEDICEASRGALTKYGLSISQTTELFPETHGLVLITTLIHLSGQWISGNYPVVPVKGDPQSLKAALTYARRGAWESISGVVSSEDDDGEAAMGRDKEGSKDNGQSDNSASNSKSSASNKDVSKHGVSSPGRDGHNEAPNGKRDIPHGTGPASAKPSSGKPDKGTRQFLATGAYKGKTFTSALEAEKGSNFSWTKSVVTEIKAHKRQTEDVLKFISYVEDTLGLNIESLA